MKTIILFSFLIISHSALTMVRDLPEAMDTDEMPLSPTHGLNSQGFSKDTTKEKRLERRCMRQFMNINSTKDLQSKLGTNLATAAELENAIFSVPEVAKKVFYSSNFKTNFAERVGISNAYYFDKPAINHAATHIAIPCKNRVYIVDLYDKESHDVVISFGCQKFWEILKIAWNSDDHYVALFTTGGLSIYDARTGKSINAQAKMIIDQMSQSLFCWHKKNPSHFIMLNSNAFSIDTIDITTGTCVQSIPTPQKNISSMECNPDGAFLALNNGSIITIVNLLDQSILVSEPQQEFIDMLSFSPNGRYILYASSNSKLVAIWDIQENKKAVDLAQWIWGELVSITWTKDGYRLIAITDKIFTGMGHYYVRNLIDPWNATDKVIATTHMDEGFMSKSAIQHMESNKMHLSHTGRFLVAFNDNNIVLYDYIANQRMHEYLSLHIPLKQAMVLLTIVKSMREGKKLLLDSPNIKTAFNELPNYLQKGLKNLVQEPPSRVMGAIYALFSSTL